MDQKKEPESNQSLNRSKSLSSADASPEKSIKPQKAPKIEDKPFEEFINDHLLPSIKNELIKRSCPINSLIFKKGKRPVVGGDCWLIEGQFPTGRMFYLTFSSNNIKSIKNVSLAESNSEPSLLESFLIDEKKITLELLTSRLLQRLNGQKWLGAN